MCTHNKKRKKEEERKEERETEIWVRLPVSVCQNPEVNC